MIADILIVHPGKHHVLNLVAGCVSAGVNVRFVTPYYSKGLNKLVNLIPGNAARKAQGYYHKLIPSQSVDAPLKFRLLKLIALYFQCNLDSKFDTFVSKAINSARYKAKVLVTLQDYMPKTVFAGKDRGMLIWSDQILNQSSEMRDRLMKHALESGVTPPNITDNKINEKILGLSDLVTVPSNYCFEGVQSLVRDSTLIRTIPYGASPSSFNRPQIRSANEVVVLARAPNLRKGGHLLLRSLEKCGETLVAKAKCPVRIVILGALDKSLKPLRQKIRWARGLTFQEGNVPHSDVPQLYSEASLFVMPSLSEGSSLACLEAMHASLPLIITKYCGVNGFMDGVMGLETSDDVPSLSDALVRAFECREMWSDWGKKAKENAKKLTWQSYENGIAEVAADLSK